MRVLEGLQPERVFYYFEEISKIPRGSGNTKAVSNYVADFAKSHALEYVQDTKNNIIVRKKAYPGYEEAPGVILQGHLDMVCEKEEGCDIDFSEEGVRLRLDGNILSAEGTTLGADDGVAVAMMLAILEDETVKAPSLECIFTVDEEMGMLGAEALDMTYIAGRRMINLDESGEKEAVAGCAGGVTALCHMPIEREASELKEFSLKISDLTGGHSGEMIDKQRANANVLMGRMLFELLKDDRVRIYDIEGGLKDNAIPRCSTAILGLTDKTFRELKERVDELSEVLKDEYALTDPEMKVEFEPCDDPYKIYKLIKWGCLDKASAARAVAALYGLPNGVVKMSPDIEGLVRTSLNLGILKSGEDEVTYSYLIRSSKESEKKELKERLACLMDALGGYVTFSGEYPAWEYKKESRLAEIMDEVCREMYGDELDVRVIHAGLECGIFFSALEGLDCVSIGPNMYDIHTPEERLETDSLKRCWEYLLACLERLR